MSERNRTLLSRRSLLKGAAGVTGGIAAASFAGIFGISAAQAAHDHMDDPQTILNLAATAETLGDGAKGKKASGMLMVDGVLYMWVRNAGNSQLAWSTGWRP